MTPTQLPDADIATLRAQLEERLQRAGIEEYRLEAQLLLMLALGISRAAVIAGIAPSPDPTERAKLQTLLEAREQRVPLSYLRGTQEFYGLEFLVSPAVLIPRPETELLVDFGLQWLQSQPENESPLMLDVGTGSGCIAIAVLANYARAQALAIDISEQALPVARANAARHGVSDRTRFAQGDLLADIRPGSCGLILSNPPYIPTGELPTLQPEVRDFEPRLALCGGDDGLTLIRRLATQAIFVLKPGGWLALEAALGQADSVAEILERAGFQRIEKLRDLAGIERMTLGQRPV